MAANTEHEHEILTIFDTPNAERWMRDAGRKEIMSPHVPLSWIPMSWSTALDALIKEGRVEIVDLPSRVPNFPPASFLVKR